MALDKAYYVHTAGDGRLADDTSESEIEKIFERIAETDQLILHFHGGLVSRASALKMAERLKPEYESFGHPVFFVWESGAIESPVNNIDEIVDGLKEIAQEAIFKKLNSVITKWSVGKLQTGAGLRGIDGQLEMPDDVTHAVEMARVEEESVPYEEVDPARMTRENDVEDVTAEERQGLAIELEADPEFVADVEGILAGYATTTDDDGLKSALTGVPPQPTRIDPTILEELAADVDPNTKGLFSAAKLAARAAQIFFRVVRRFIAGRDHGIYTTVVEEILRELYLASVGSVVWDVMKRDTADAFVSQPGEVRGGELFLRKLIEMGDDRPKKIVLVGHSTGAVFINELLKATRSARRAGLLPPDFAYSGVVFLAPACTFGHFSDVLPTAAEPPLFQKFRMFTMSDESERVDRLVSFLYPRSLLYFVSGVVEREKDGSGAFDMPLVGMERYYGRNPEARDAYLDVGEEIAAVRAFMEEWRGAVWSPSGTDARDGFRADATSHGAFDDTGLGKDGKPVPRAVMDSVRHILESGWD